MSEEKRNIAEIIKVWLATLTKAELIRYVWKVAKILIGLWKQVREAKEDDGKIDQEEATDIAVWLVDRIAEVFPELWDDPHPGPTP